MSTSGSAVRRWSTTQPASTARPNANRPSVRPSSQPHSLAREIASSGAARPTASTSAPRTSTRPGVRTGDSGMNSSVAIAASTAVTAPSQKM